MRNDKVIIKLHEISIKMHSMFANIPKNIVCGTVYRGK